MSNLLVPVYRTEAGVHANPAPTLPFTTHCDGQKKTFSEVYIYWDLVALEWVESLVLLAAIPGVRTATRVALKVVNVCAEDTYAYIDYKYTDFKQRQECCSNDYCALINWTFTDEIGDFNVTFYIIVNGVDVVTTSITASGFIPVQAGDNIQVVAERANLTVTDAATIQVISETYNFLGTAQGLGTPTVQSAVFQPVCGNNITVAGVQSIVG